MFNNTYSINEVINALKAIRVPLLAEEYELHDLIAQTLTAHGIGYKKEFILGPRKRIDFLIDGGIGIEAKKGKPPRTGVVNQLIKYAESPKVIALILVIERSMDIPGEINGKQCISFGLNRLWGVAT